MKVLVFHIGSDRFGLPLAGVHRVLPAARLTPLPGAPDWVAGLLDLHGAPVPVLDLSRMAGLSPDAVRHDTRILLLDYVLPGGAVRPLGLQAAHVIGVHEVPDAQFGPAGVAAAPWLGPVASTGAGMLQLVTGASLLTPEACALLYPEESAA